ncbi:MAG: hypothetical protein JWQ27_2525 [Ferruginibacter sp.]|nr:hypothetical protein [Ferruginibacter sp.]
MEEPLVSLIDLFLLPVYFVLCMIGAVYYKKKHPGDELVQKYFIKGFIVKILGALLYALLIVYYWGFGDSATYFKEVLQLRELLAQNRTTFSEIFLYDYSFFRDNFNLIGSVNNNGFMVTKIALLFSYLGFSRFLITTLLFSVIAYAGLFTLFKIFARQIPRLTGMVAFFTIFFPSIAMYGSGILKDTVCMTALCFMFYYSYQFFISKIYSLRYAAMIVLCAYFIIVIKSYILAAFLAPFAIFLVIQVIRRIESAALRTISFILIFLLGIGIIFVMLESIMQTLGIQSAEQMQNEMQNLQSEYAKMNDNADSNFSIGAMDPSIGGMIRKMPAGFVATLYRPFLWEARKIFVLFTALESLFISLFTLYVIFKAGLFNFIKKIFTDPIAFLCIFFSIIFAGLVGLSTPNFGTLARYRIPVIPFYLMGLLMILYRSGISKLKKH